MNNSWNTPVAAYSRLSDIERDQMVKRFPVFMTLINASALDCSVSPEGSLRIGEHFSVGLAWVGLKTVAKVRRDG
jgi:hypothetical protein